MSDLVFGERERAGEHFASVLEGFVDEGEEVEGVDGGQGAGVEADDGRVDLGTGIKTMGGDGEGAVEVGIELDEEGEGAKILGAGWRGHAGCDLFLNHESEAGERSGKELLENGAGDVIGKVGDDLEMGGEALHGEGEEVGLVDSELVALNAVQLGGKGSVDLNGVDVGPRFEKGGGEGARARANF